VTRAHGQRGVTLIELMIAVVLGLLVIGAVGAIFLNSSRGYNEDQRLLRLQDEARVALDQVVTDIEMAGYWGTVLLPSTIENDVAAMATPPNGCGMFFNAPLPDIRTATSADYSSFTCISTSNSVRADTQLIGVNRVASTTTDKDALEDEYVYLETVGTDGRLFQCPADCSDDASLSTVAAAEYWEVSPVIYYVSDSSTASGTDGLPTLCRKIFIGSGITTQCFGVGVENMVLEYGLDTDFDGVANRYTRNPADDTELRQIAAVRVHLLVRSEEPAPGYSNTKSYQLGPVTVAAANDRYFRKVISATAVPRNVISHYAIQ
jgi:type IV pilus assembly protein PilW